MTSLTLLLFFILSLSTIAKAQERAPHGLVYESPIAFSPEAYDFFHPDAQPGSSKGPCSSPHCMTFPEAATVKSTPAHESTSTPDAGRKQLGAGTIASIPTALIMALILGMGVYYVVMARQTNAAKARAAQELQNNV